MNKSFAAIFAVTFAIATVGEDKVLMKEDTIVLPTYAPGGYDKTPLFYTGRVYQGAQGRVYPYPMQDVLHDERKDETYKYLTLENNWLQMGLLPEHGGHLLNFTDKATGFETLFGALYLLGRQERLQELALTERDHMIMNIIHYWCL